MERTLLLRLRLEPKLNPRLNDDIGEESRYRIDEDEDEGDVEVATDVGLCNFDREGEEVSRVGERVEDFRDGGVFWRVVSAGLNGVS